MCLLCLITNNKIILDGITNHFRLPTAQQSQTSDNALQNHVNVYIQVLERKGSPAGGRLIIISDGLDGNEDKFAEAEAAIKDKGVIVDSILYTANADDRLSDLASATSGHVFFVEGSSTSLIQGLIQANSQAHQLGSMDKQIQVLEIYGQLCSNTAYIIK